MNKFATFVITLTIVCFAGNVFATEVNSKIAPSYPTIDNNSLNKCEIIYMPIKHISGFENVAIIDTACDATIPMVSLYLESSRTLEDAIIKMLRKKLQLEN